MSIFSEIHSLYLKCFRDSSPHQISLKNASNYILQLLATCEVINVRRNDKLVGCIVYQKFHNTLLDEDEIFIHEWFVHPSWRKKFVGAELYRELVRVGKSLNCKRLKGVSFNPEMINTIRDRDQKEAKTVGVLFEKELM